MSDIEEVPSASLHKSLGFVSVLAITLGTTLSAGFFLLPGLAFAKAGPAVVLSYALASLAVLPALFSVVELCTAMPKAGGAYYFLDRSMGPVVGTIGGLGTWLALVLKTSFALVGMGYYISLYTDAIPLRVSAIGLAAVFGVLNLRGTEGATKLQVVLSCGLITILLWFLGGVPSIQAANFDNLFEKGWTGILLAAGMVVVSFGSLTKVASMAQEVQHPEKNLPKGVLTGIFLSMIIYVLGTAVMVGVIPADKMATTYTPAAEAAFILSGKPGMLIVTVAALLSFASVANAGILSASRYPLAMSNDQLLPPGLGKINKSGIPVPGVAATTGTIIFVLFVFGNSAGKLAKLASSFVLLVFALLALCVIIMRESRIDSYDPSFKSPWYPWMQVAGIAVPIFMIAEMGVLSQVFTETVVILGGLWFYKYARHNVKRDGAIFHIFERLGRRRYEALDSELRGIMKEKGLRAGDPFDDIIARSDIISFPDSAQFEEAARQASNLLSNSLKTEPDHLYDGFMRGTQIGATPVAKGVALPHLRIPDIEHPEMVLVRAPGGIHIQTVDDFGETVDDGDTEVRAAFFLVSPESDPSRHLRILAQIAGKVDDEAFMQSYLAAENEQEVKECLLRDERFLSLIISNSGKSSALHNLQIFDVAWPEGCLVALIHREGFTFVPRGNTILKDGDRLTILGDADGIAELARDYVDSYNPSAYV